jgi:hypothetical protein
VSFSNVRAKPTSALLTVGPHTSDRSKGYETDSERYWNSDTNSSGAGSSDTSTGLKHRANDARDVS